jgi:hypothetical protein
LCQKLLLLLVVLVVQAVAGQLTVLVALVIPHQQVHLKEVMEVKVA